MSRVKQFTEFTCFYITVIFMTVSVIILTNQTVLTISKNKTLEREHLIIIDAGHGGEDGGAISCTGKPESSYNLEISKRFNDICHLLGYATRMIRTEDVSIYKSGNTILQKKVSDLKERARIVNESEGKVIFLSIHQNYFSQPRYHGAQVFFGAGEGSDELAKRIQTRIAEYLNPGSKRMAKRGEGIYVLEKTNCPAILLECGFLSNPEEEMRLGQAEYQKKIVTLLTATLADYLGKG